MSLRKLIREQINNIFNNIISESTLGKVTISDLYVESDNILDAYFKAKNNLGASSRSTGRPLSVTKLLDGSLVLLDGHHRIIDKIKYLDTNNIDDILNLSFDAIITTENYEDLDDFPNGEYWMPLSDWIYNMEDELLSEDITLPIEIGDEILTGKFKNKKTKIKTIGKNEKGDLTINNKPALKFRVVKNLDEDSQRQIFTTLYHGTDLVSALNIQKKGVSIDKGYGGYFGWGFYTTPDYDLAKSNYADFSGDEEGGVVLKFELSKNANILDLRNSEDFEIWKPFSKKISDKNLYKELISLGIDGLWDDSFDGVVVYNPKVLVFKEIVE